MGIEAWLTWALLGLMLSLVSALFLQCRTCWRLLTHWHNTPFGDPLRPSRHAEENRELRSALRAHVAHVAQLERKVELLQAFVPAACPHQLTSPAQLRRRKQD